MYLQGKERKVDKMFRVIFFDYRYGQRVGYSPYYNTKEDCDRFIKGLLQLPNGTYFSSFQTEEMKSKDFSEKDVDKFKDI